MKNQVFIRVIIIILIGCSFSNCARINNSWFGDAVHYLPDSEFETRIFIDRYGSLYPKDSSIRIDYNGFHHNSPKADEKQRKIVRDKTLSKKCNDATLDYYFNFIDNEIGWQKLKASTNITLPDSPIWKTFLEIQDVLSKSVATIINQNFDKGKSDLIILIHGFNDVNPGADYLLMKNDIRNHYISKSGSDAKLQFLELYWDGLTANQGNPATSAIWGKAQNNSIYAGLRLRRILQYSNPAINVRVITHSLGASVATHCFFNPQTMVQINDYKFNDLKQQLGTNFCPQPDIRIGSLAAAIPGQTTFTNFNKIKNNYLQKDIYPIQKFILGYNENDYALRKSKIIPANWGKFGATSLGCNYNNEVEITSDSLKNKIPFIPVNFTSFENKQEQHSFIYYRSDRNDLIRDKYANFIKALLN